MNPFWKIKLAPGLKLDLASNFAGVGWSFLVQIVCIPLYVRLLGIEAYGLIGFYLMLQTMLQVLDFGLSPTMNREMARYSVQPEKAAEARDFVRTLEAGYWLIGIAIGGVILAAAPVIAKHWIKAGAISIRTVTHAVMIMGVLSVFQWPLSFYQGALMGLGRQVQFNCLKIAMVTLSQGGAVLVLWLISPSITALLTWQVAAVAVQSLSMTLLLWRSLPTSGRSPRFNLMSVRRSWRFAAGMSGITAGALILTQTDKVVLSKLLTLKMFGYYSIAGVFGTGLSMIVASVFNTIFPRFSALAAAGEEHALKRLYHRCSQLMAVLILPLAAVLALFSTEILQLWTRNTEVASNAGPIATLLVIGSALNGLMTLPYALQLAYGWTSIGLSLVVVLIILIVPAIWIMATLYGAIGAACVWAGLNGIYMVIGVPLTHRRLLKGEAWRWFGEILAPLLPALLIAFFFRGVVNFSMSTPVAICALPVSLFCATSAAALFSPLIRPWFLNQISRAKTSC